MSSSYSSSLPGLDAVKVNNLLENTTHRVDRLMDGKESERDLPLLTLPNTTGGKPLSSSNGNYRKAAPVYVKHGFPTILKPSTSSNGNHSKASPYHHLLPKMPGTADDSYGMIYNKPETEAERTMNELWLARRRQEAFEWKTQQHLALVMDRLALHKSRLESDALRKQEYTFLMKNSKMRPSSAPIAHHTPSDKDALAGPPIGSRGMSGTMDSEDKDRSHPRMLRNLSSDEYSLSPRSASPGRHHSRRTRFKKLSSDPGSESDNYAAENATRRLDRLSEGNTSTVVVSEHGSETVSNIARPSRISVAKQPPQVTKLPMRFKVDRPEDYSTQQKVYMQLSDSDDDDIPDRPIKSLKSSKGIKKPSTAKKGPGPTAPPAPATFKHERPVVRERPVSAKMFHVISTNDPEFKVHYRHSNYRRMPLTEKQEMWLDEQEMHRIHVSEESAKKLVDQYTAKMEKAKGKGKDKKAEKKDKGEKGKESKKKGDTVKVEEEKVKPKYKSASHFMATQFPNFEDDDDFDTQGPMRTIQLLEVAQIMDVCDEYDVKIKESAVRKALLIPQDRPEAICLENLRSEKEGLMINPNPREFWRKFTAKKGGKKGKKKKKKA